MELLDSEWEGCAKYLDAYGILIGDRRSEETLRGVIEGVIAGESVLAARIARFSPSAGGGEAQ